MKKESFRKLTNLTLVTTLTVVPVVSPISVYATSQEKSVVRANNQIEMAELSESDLNKSIFDYQNNSFEEKHLKIGRDNIELDDKQPSEGEGCDFDLTSWIHGEEDDYIWLSEYKGSDTSLCIPGEYGGKRIQLSSTRKFPENLVSLRFKSVNGQKVTIPATNTLMNEFSGMKNLKTLDLSGFDTSNIEYMKGIFSGLSSLTSLNLSGFDTSKVKSMEFMFSGVESLISLDVSGFDTSNVKSMYGMFSGMTSLTSLDVSGFDTSKVTTMHSMFKGLEQLTSLDVSGFDTSNVTDMRWMFSGINQLKELDLSNFNTSKVTNMAHMFNRGVNRSTQLTTLDLSSFDTSNVTNMYGMFSGMTSLTSLDLTSFNTSKVKDMTYMFEDVESLTSLDLSSFDTSNVTNMNYMFSGMKSIEMLDLSHFNTKSLRSMQGIFSGSNKLKVIDMSNFDLSSVTNMKFLFKSMVEDYLPLLIITNDSKLKDYDFKAEGRIGTQLTLQANGGIFKDGSISYKTSELFTIDSIDEGYVRDLISKLQKENGNPIHSNYSVFEWEAAVNSLNNGLEKVYEQLNGTYNASWGYKFKTFTYNTPTISTTIMSGKGIPGAKVGVYTNNGKRLAITTVNSKGTYQLMIPKQKAGTKLTLKQAKSNYQTLSKLVTVLNEFKIFTIKNTSNSSVAIYGTGEPGANVKAFIDGKAISSLTRVNSKGNYKIVISKQKAGTVVQVKMAKEGYKTISNTVTILDEFKTFTYNTPSISSTAISGKGTPGAKVGIYTSSGARLAITTVNSKGNYKLTIPKQKAGTVLTIKQAKSGYLTLSKTVTVLKEFKTFSIKKVSASSVAIYGTGEPGANVKAFIDGKAISSLTKVNSKGNYKIVIPKQKTGTVVQVKMAKDGYQTISQNVKVVK